MGTRNQLIVLLLMILASACIHRPPDGGPLSPPPGQGGSTLIQTPCPDADIGDGELTDADEPVVNGDEAPPLGTLYLLSEARKLTIEGLEHYKAGQFDDARLKLDNAMIRLTETEIPDDMKVLELLGVNLPNSFQGYDLAQIMDKLETLSGSDSEKDDDTFIECQVRRMFLTFGEPFPNEEGLATVKEEIHRYIRFYQTDGREFFTHAYERLPKYRPIVAEVFAEKSLPEDLIYMVLVESGFKCRAYSRARARGIWQFIAATGQRYGLHVSHRYDERLDPIKSTRAAREYLLDLIGIFGSKSFFLAMAAYNAGEARISNCLRTLDNPFEDRTFWHIRDCMALETREYIPKIMAAAMIAKDPKRFGFDLRTLEEFDTQYDIAVVPSVARIRDVAKALDLPEEEVRALNPDIPAGNTSTPVQNFPIYIPKDREILTTGVVYRLADVFTAMRAPVPTTAPTPSDTPPGDGTFTYIVQRGNRLDQITRWFGTSIETIRMLNPSIGIPVPGDRLLLPVGSPPVSRIAYTIKRGDTLQTIARRFGVEYQMLADWNGLDQPYRIIAGETLNVYTGGSETTEGATRITYLVKKGNYLFAIGEAFDVDYRKIMRWNNLRRGNIYPGQKLVIHPPRPVYEKTHVVQKGEYLAMIAERYGVSLQSLAVVNGVARDALVHPGQALVVYTFNP
ncbi:LysM peptidoglycan-binding domain-containing protein [bacterium]|nr:LysM peptidoglycan-binding domain-containing protein [candidate division CSSED10-310 bacterium]